MTIQRSNRRLKAVVAGLCAVTLVAACGSDDDAEIDVSTTTEETGTDTTLPGPDTAQAAPDTTASTPAESAAGSGEGPGRADIVDTFMESGLNERAANCVADKIEDEYGADVFEQEEPPPEIETRAQEFGEECARQSVSVPQDAEGRDGLIQVLTSGGLTPEAANCVADKIEDEYGQDVYDATVAPDGFEAKAAEFGEQCAQEVAET